MALSEPVHVARRLGPAMRIGACRDVCSLPDDRTSARTRLLEPGHDGFGGVAERDIDLLACDVSHRVA